MGAPILLTRAICGPVPYLMADAGASLWPGDLDLALNSYSAAMLCGFAGVAHLAPNGGISQSLLQTGAGRPPGEALVVAFRYRRKLVCRAQRGSEAPGVLQSEPRVEAAQAAEGVHAQG